MASVLGLLTLEKELREAQLCSPFTNFAIELQPVEYRRDPLTGIRCRINVRRAERSRQAARRSNSTAHVLEASRKGCVFCPENLQKMTPCFPDQLVHEKRLQVGSAVLFPNLYPFGEHHAIAVFSEEHSVALDKFSPMIIQDCIKVCVEYLMRIHAKNPDVKYGSINWNYMPPAGGSIVHPHLQVLVDRRPTYFQEKLISCSEAYYRKNGSNYWQDLVETELELGARLIHVDNSMIWLASYAPQANNEVLGLFPKLSSISDMDQRSLEALSSGISGILKGYYHLGVESLNMSLLSGPVDGSLDYYALNLRMNSRPSLEKYYTSDCGFMERIQLESVAESMPEDVARGLRSYFTATN